MLDNTFRHVKRFYEIYFYSVYNDYFNVPLCNDSSAG